jgi:hypothetical protein
MAATFFNIDYLHVRNRIILHALLTETHNY